MTDVIDIINTWISHATERKLLFHKKMFWYIRDILEGTFQPPDYEILIIIQWLKENTNDTEQRSEIIKTLEGKII